MARDEAQNYVLKVSTNASGSGTSDYSPMLWGVLWGFIFDFSASAPSTTDVTVKASVAGQEVTLLTLTDVNTDGAYPIQMTSYTPANVAAGYVHYILTGEKIYFTVAQGGASVTDCVTMVIKVL